VVISSYNYVKDSVISTRYKSRYKIDKVISNCSKARRKFDTSINLNSLHKYLGKNWSH
jgi:hypothetical protein